MAGSGDKLGTGDHVGVGRAHAHGVSEGLLRSPLVQHVVRPRAGRGDSVRRRRFTENLGEGVAAGAELISPLGRLVEV